MANLNAWKELGEKFASLCSETSCMDCPLWDVEGCGDIPSDITKGLETIGSEARRAKQKSAQLKLEG